VGEFQASEFQLWRHHPITQVVLAFLSDRRDDLYAQAFAAFLVGGLASLGEAELRGRYLGCEELIELRWQQVCDFYGVVMREEEVKDA
jgi:hypothetical protein